MRCGECRQLPGATSDLGRGEARQLRVERGGRAVQLLLVERAVGQLALQRRAVEPPLDDVAVAEHEHQHPRAIRQRHQLNVAELGAP